MNKAIWTFIGLSLILLYLTAGFHGIDYKIDGVPHVFQLGNLRALR